MRDALLIFIIIICSIAIGGYLYLNGVPDETFTEAPAVPAAEPEPAGSGDFIVLAEGDDAGALTRRTNYRITTDEQFTELWSLIYGQDAPAAPVVDFTQHEVIGVFDGSHSTGGYRVSVTEVADEDGQRTVRVLRELPGEDCATAQGFTSPFQLIRVSKTTLPLTREETAIVQACA